MRLLTALLLLALGASAVENGIGMNRMVSRLKQLKDAREHDSYYELFSAPTIHELFQANNSDICKSSLSDGCYTDFEAIYNVFKAWMGNPKMLMNGLELAAMQLIDATGKIPPGLFHGAHNFIGSYSECIAVDATYKDSNTNSTRHLKGSYNRIIFGVNGMCTAKHTGKLGWDLCLPNSCANNKDLRNLMNCINPTWSKRVCDVKTTKDQQVPYDAGTWIMVTIMSAIAITGILAAIYDYFGLPHHKNLPYVKSFGMKVFLSFSFYTNICEIFNTDNAKKAGQISPIHCIRFFSMCWVILGHTLGVFLAYSNNPMDVMAELQYISTQIITNAYYAVDSFLFLSGLLVAYMWFKMYNRNKRQTMSAPAWILFYVHRLLRLSPPYYIAILFYTFVFRTFLFNMPVYMTEVIPDPCPKNWWVNLLYLNNFINYDEQCYLVSWYLSTDLQIYIFSPLILIPMAIRPIFGFISAAGLFLASTAANLATVYTLDYPPSDYPYGPMDQKEKHSDMYTMLIYDAPWIRCQPYIIGMMTGYLLIQKPKMRINWIFNLVMWVVTAGLMAACTLTLFDWARGTEINITSRAMYSALSKPAWGLALAWIIISCFYGYGGPINSFMSWEIWVPLGRLSYCAYLIHICVIVYVTGLNETALIWSNFSQSTVSFIIPVIGLTYFFSIFWSAAFEISLGKVEGLLIGNLRASRAPRAPREPLKADGMETAVSSKEGIPIENGANQRKPEELVEHPKDVRF
ncbi:hypothetical protein L596_011104 [Steinernema carpocapsae]|uniref:Nose resistant-to-fluoxetine protein N-terminal domain-containing protein n=1 Tax=Steinernema carpocapsae TaxID=34508 RepID=A0A4U5NSH9_STECR|nr:hypothetical protein L596_011104 [Steinernema carpocapsae]